jgi:hypothetical protein
VAELVDAQVSGTCGRNVVEVRVFSWAPLLNTTFGVAAGAGKRKKSANVAAAETPRGVFYCLNSGEKTRAEKIQKTVTMH